MTAYCNIALLKDRLLIGVNDTQYDDALNNAADEASRLVDIFIKPYTTVPLTTPDSQIIAITADFGTSIFKRRMLPDEVRMRGTDILQPDLGAVDATGWFALALRKIEQYIKNYYVLTQAFAENGSTVHNPRLYLQMLKEGIITGKEARQMMNNATIETIKEIQELTKTLITNETITLSKDITDILNQTVTRALNTSDLQNISKTLAETITSGITKTLSDNETIVVGKTLTQSLVDSLNKTIATNETATLVKDVTDTLNQTIGRTLTTTDTQNISKTLVDTINDTLHKIYTDNETISIEKALTQTLNDTVTRSIATNETITRAETLTTNDTVSEYKTRRQKSFIFVKSDKDSGYEVE